MNTFLFVLLALFNTTEPKEDSHKKDAAKPFVIVELFTSEGCSSCPSADRLLSQIVDNEYQDAEVMGLSFHVDYWDYIGWKDPYADKRFSQRQRTYAQKLKSYQVYTPQMIVNGRHEFVGSNQRKWMQVYEVESTNKTNSEISIVNTSIKGKSLQLDLAHQLDNGHFINVALVERELSQDVTRGENRGRKLRHDNVVRRFQILQIGQKSTTLNLEDVDLTKASVIVYAQKNDNYEIVAADQYKF